MSLFESLFSGIGGAAVGAGMSYYIYHKSKKKPPAGKAYQILKELGKRLKEPEGEYCYTRSTDDNFQVAEYLFASADSTIIATSFNEDPALYGDRDLAFGFPRAGSLFTRITCGEVCPEESRIIAQKSLEAHLNGASFIVIPNGKLFTRMDGIFCRFIDDTHLAFVSFRDTDNPKTNKGVIFRDGIAEYFFKYYLSIKEKYAQ